MDDKNRFSPLAEKSWELILQSIQKLREDNRTLHEIATMLGVKNRALVSEWLSGKRELSRSGFANILNYLDVLGYAVYGDIILPKSDIPQGGSVDNGEEIEKLMEEIKRLKKENEKYKEKLEAIKDISRQVSEGKKGKKGEKKKK